MILLDRAGTACRILAASIRQVSCGRRTAPARAGRGWPGPRLAADQWSPPAAIGRAGVGDSADSLDRLTPFVLTGGGSTSPRRRRSTVERRDLHESSCSSGSSTTGRGSRAGRGARRTNQRAAVVGDADYRDVEPVGYRVRQPHGRRLREAATGTTRAVIRHGLDCIVPSVTRARSHHLDRPAARTRHHARAEAIYIVRAERLDQSANSALSDDGMRSFRLQDLLREAGVTTSSSGCAPSARRSLADALRVTPQAPGRRSRPRSPA